MDIMKLMKQAQKLQGDVARVKVAERREAGDQTLGEARPCRSAGCERSVPLASL